MFRELDFPACRRLRRSSRGAQISFPIAFGLAVLAAAVLLTNHASLRPQVGAAPSDAPATSSLRLTAGFSDPGGQTDRSTGVEQDRAALLALYQSANGKGWTNDSNWLSEQPLGNWYGVSVGADGRVERLQLVQNGLSGQIPDEIGSLSRLNFLNLSVNALGGEIPPSLGDLADLDTLGLSNNQLGGPIPAELGLLKNLRVLGLASNQLTGPIPDELGNLARLEHLILTDNRLTGRIPSSIGNLSRLAHLVLHVNQLSGSIPATLGDLSRLQSLHLNNNSLSGQIPTQLGKLVRLKRIYASGNRLSGCLPQRLSRVGQGDAGQLQLQVCPFGLLDLDASPGMLEPEFSGLHQQYILRVAIDTGSITLVPHADSGTVGFRTSDMQPVPDADQRMLGHQIQLSGQETLVNIRANSVGGKEALYSLNVVRGLPWRLTVTDNLYVQAPGNEDLKHNIPDLEVVIGAQVLRADFLSHFNETGKIERWGYPTSEVLVLEPDTLTQFYQRGVVDFHNVGAGWVVERRLAWDYVGGGRGGSQDQGVEDGVLNPNEGTLVGPWGHKVSNFAIDGTEVGFADFYDRLGGTAAFGFPKTDARVDDGGAGTLQIPGATLGFIRQYFQASVLEFHPYDAAAPVKLTLLGDTLRGLLVKGWEGESGFARAEEVFRQTSYVPPVVGV